MVQSSKKSININLIIGLLVVLILGVISTTYILNKKLSAVSSYAGYIKPPVPGTIKPTVPPPAPQPHATGNIRGVTFFYLDGVAQDFPWILEHQTDPTVRAKIDALLADYRAAGVNWIRILVNANHHPYFNTLPSDPTAPPRFLKSVNDFMAITRSGANAGQFNIEVVLGTLTDSTGLFTDTAPYTRDKQWLKTWINGLDYTNLGMVLIAGDMQPCGWDGSKFVCSPNGTVPTNNHGAWLTAIWPWVKQNWPNLKASYEVIAGTTNTTELIKKQAAWVTANTPTVSSIAASLYFDLAPGSTWQDYAAWTVSLLQAYKESSTKPLWIDEYGSAVSPSRTESDQAAYYNGFLGASTCQSTIQYPKFAWTAGNDYPYTGQSWTGLVRSFNLNKPVWRGAWSTLSQYYNLPACP